MSEETPAVTLSPIEVPVHARSSLTSEQAAAFWDLVKNSNLLALPAGKSADDVIAFDLGVQLKVGGHVSATIK
jgi:hypothetical protein